MRRIQVKSIKNKLTIIIMLITAIALVVACTTIVIFDYISLKNQLVREYEILAQLTGRICSGPITFGFQWEAQEFLDGLRDRTHLISAQVYDESGQLFAAIPTMDGNSQRILQSNGYEFQDEKLVVYHEIILGDDKVGSVLIEASLEPLRSRISTYLLIVAGVFIISTIAALLLTTRLQQLISRPILQLASTARQVSLRNDYSIRAQKYSNDELGFLTEQFNEMLKQIQERETALQAVQGKLKEQAEKLQQELEQRKQLEEDLERAQRLETAGRIAGQIAHDFNNLLSPLAAYPSLIRQELPDAHPSLEMLEQMEHSANKIAEINQQLLALGRRGHYTMSPINLNDLVEKVTSTLSIPDSVLVRQELAPDLLYIKGGAAQITRAITNVVLNAFEAITGSGSVNIKSENIYIEKQNDNVPRGEYVKVSISDTGTGIDEEYFDKIFDPFFTTKQMDKRRGSGLGLSVVHGVLEDHNGYTTVESEAGLGTTFSFYFPVSRDVQTEAIKTQLEMPGGEESILIVDDDPIQRKVAHQVLDHLGYKVHTISSGEEAVQYVKKNPQDLLLLDMLMEGMDGTETYRRILEFRPDQKAIVLSGYAMSKRVKEAIKLGAGGFISKPISINSLAVTIRKELDTVKNAVFSDHS